MSEISALAIVATVVVVVGAIVWMMVATRAVWLYRSDKSSQDAQDGADVPAAPNPPPVVLEAAYASPRWPRVWTNDSAIPVEMEWVEICVWVDHANGTASGPAAPFHFRRWSDLDGLNAERAAMGYPPIVRKVQ